MTAKQALRLSLVCAHGCGESPHTLKCERHPDPKTGLHDRVYRCDRCKGTRVVTAFEEITGLTV
jgi:hypothetical protein